MLGATLNTKLSQNQVNSNPNILTHAAVLDEVFKLSSDLSLRLSNLVSRLQGLGDAGCAKSTTQPTGMLAIASSTQSNLYAALNELETIEQLLG